MQSSSAFEKSAESAAASKNAVQKSAEKLQAYLEQHRRLLACVLGDGARIAQIHYCPHIECPHQIMLRKVLLETIEVLEESRRAFKSRQLEELRRKLTRVLAEMP